MKRQLFLLLTTLAISITAASGCAKGEDIMGSAYAQPYDVPFQGSVPPIFPAATMNDEFTVQHPPKNPDFPGGYVRLEEKWQPFDPGENLLFSAVDQQRVMAVVLANGTKSWTGIYQPLPDIAIPGLNQAVAYDIYARAIVGSIGSGFEEDYSDQMIGLMLGIDLAGTPATSGLVGTFLSYSRATDIVEPDTCAAAFATYDAPFNPVGRVKTPLQYLRIRVESENVAGVYDTRVVLSASPDGVGWLPLKRMDPLADVFRHVMLGARSEDNTDIVAYFDFVRFYPDPNRIDLHDPTTGGIQYFGAV